MKLIAAALLVLSAAAAHADSANVMQAASVLDFDVPRTASDGLDLDGDGQISRAEAAGHAEVTLGFDRADRNRNGKVSAAEWQRYEKWQAARAKAREARLARAKGKESASAGATRSKPARRSAP
jgi:hypothetical protein